MTRKQKAVFVGMILGDAYLQKTGENNARIRLEHSDKQEDYLIWKARVFPEYFQGKPVSLSRFNSQFGKTYSYVRWQSNASSEIGKWRKVFYDLTGRKVIPQEIKKLLTDPWHDVEKKYKVGQVVSGTISNHSNSIIASNFF